jgi:transcriptional antiterminator RfaH
MSNEKAHDITRWYAIHTNAGQEGRADSNLIAWGVETFAPKLRESRHNQYTGDQTHIIKSLFPRYIFAKFKVDILLHKVRFTRGVHNVVSFGDRPTPVDDEVIAIIKSRILKDGFVRIGEELSLGDQVMVKDGPLSGVIGMLEKKTRGADRVTILLTTVSYQSRVIIERELVKKV